MINWYKIEQSLYRWPANSWFLGKELFYFHFEIINNNSFIISFNCYYFHI
ncbi:hypothetical protein X975_02762, partial [Stegodyphus mimosarum]